VERSALRAAAPPLLVASLGLAVTGGCASTGDQTPPDISPDAGVVTGDDAGLSSGMPAPGAIGVAIFGSSCDAGGAPSVDWAPMRRVSRVEYDNMVRDLLGDTTAPANAFPPESPMTTGVNLQTNTYAGASELVVQDYVQAAETLAKTAVADTNTLNNTLLTGCTDPTDTCAQKFIDRFAGRAFRGPLDSDESSSLLSLYSDVKSKFDFPTGIRAVITAVLESPRFLYVVELGGATPTGSVTALTSYEVAARLALFLWRSVPDDALMTAAAAGNLATADQVAQQAARMIADPRAVGAVDDFTTQWMQLQSTAVQGKDTQFKQWTATRGQEMQRETLLNASQLVLAKNGGLAELLTTPESYVSSDLATFYGVMPGSSCVNVNDPAVGGAWCATSLPNRAGLLTNGAVQSTQAHTTLPSSVLRGKLVRENVLCDVIQPPPPDVPPPATSVPEGGTTRDLLEAHFNKSPCVNCHQYMDAIGLGFGHFDATGAYQDTDSNGLGPGPAIDATGQIAPMATGEFSATFDGAVDLAMQLSTAPQVEQCFALQEMRYALGRIETANDACSAQQVFGGFSSSAFNVQALLVAVTKSDAFRYRSLQTAGSSCR